MSNQHNYTHFIKLIPYGKFFFGGESFSDKDNTTFYFQQSEEFPQQTSILGMLRYQLLLQNKCLDENGKMIGPGVALIGGDSFDPEKNLGFGAVKKVSPVFLIDGQGERCYAYPKLKQKEKDELLPPTFKKVDNNVSASFNGNTKPAYGIEGFNAKESFEHGFLSIDSDKYYTNEQVFDARVKEQIGIFKTDTLAHRSLEEGDDRDGFFKLTYKKLKKGFSFGFYAALSLGEQTVLQSTDLVYLGKERSAFKLEVSPIEDAALDVSESTFEQGDLVWLLADAYVDTASLYQHCEGALSTDKSFRCLISNVRSSDQDKERFNYFSKPVESKTTQENSKRMRRSFRYNLMKKGSLLQVGNAAEFNAAIQKDNFNKIGYNHFKKIK